MSGEESAYKITSIVQIFLLNKKVESSKINEGPESFSIASSCLLGCRLSGLCHSLWYFLSSYKLAEKWQGNGKNNDS